ncbi:hypothetical protein [Pontiella agarivorans]|uniref:STAS domain-containing protein n=1 Tax=Pontiella agarivorans TaxID=3038953 RepID=A0ABU5MV20_9BACT|nr:hypothetical protein [Pontiella agarivorans]MDZ8117988.1 hypothetical protein [Pontiella agarivorans]
MYLFEIDTPNNRMHIMLADHFTEQEARELLEKCTSRIKEVNPEYKILCDLTALKTFEHPAKMIYRSIMDLFNETGAKKIIRLFSDPRQTFGMNIMSTFHYNDNVEIISTDSLSRARKHLE